MLIFGCAILLVFLGFSVVAQQGLLLLAGAGLLLFDFHREHVSDYK